jgi:ubiquinone biosynthesis protein
MVNTFTMDNVSYNSEYLLYQKKSPKARFYKVYFFVLGWALRLFWHYKVRKFYMESRERQDLEVLLYQELSQDCKKLFLSLGGVYIKAGQFLSSLAHIFPPEFTDPLKDLQDRVPSHDFSEIRKRFEKEIGKQIEEVFPDITRQPIASASTAQVHTATLYGKKVAVKILYPAIEKLVATDLETIYIVMRLIDRFFFSYDYLSIHSEIKTMILREMNLKLEAESIQKMAKLFKNEKDYVFPTVFEEYSRHGILVTKFIEGVKITETRINQKGSPKLSRPLNLLLKAYVLMVFKYRFFHADPHSGNLIYTPQGKLCFIDFGAVAELPQETSQYLKQILLSAMAEDYFGVVDGMEKMGFFKPNSNKEKLEQVAEFAIQKLKAFVSNTDFFQNISLDQLAPKDAKIFLEGINSSLRELMKATQVPNHYVLLERVLGLLTGISAVLDPYRTIYDYAEPHLQTVLESRKKEAWEKLKSEGNEISAALLELPSQLQKTLVAINRGRLKVSNPEMQKHTEKMYALGQELSFTVLGIAGIYFGNQFLSQNYYVSLGFYATSLVFFINLIRSWNRNRSSKI